ncbi:MAG: hypothetical protein AAB214_04030 [Fibrobacterota bacterium]
MSMRKWLAILPFACAAAASASEGDFIIEVGPQAVGRTYLNYQSPMMGLTASVLSGFNDRTDIGVTASVDFAKQELGDENQTWTTLGVQSWYTAFNGDIRPQIGGSVGITMDGDGNGMMNLTGRMRGVMELSTRFRLYAGAALGADIGDEGCSFIKGEFGAQFLSF